MQPGSVEAVLELLGPTRHYDLVTRVGTDNLECMTALAPREPAPTITHVLRVTRNSLLVADLAVSNGLDATLHAEFVLGLACCFSIHQVFMHPTF